MTYRDFRVRVYRSSATDLSTSGVDFTLGSSQLASAPTVAGSVVRPLDGRAESSPWPIDVIDVASSFTAQLADSSGRLDLLRRLVQVQRSTASGTWASLGVGRITDVLLNDDVASYQIVAEDERVLERAATIFTTNTTRLFPPGPHTAYGPFSPTPKGTFKVASKYSSVAQWINWLSPSVRMTPAGADAIRNDRRSYADLVTLGPLSTHGNFEHVRLRVGNTDYGILAFANNWYGVPNEITEGLDAAVGQGNFWVLVNATTSQLVRDSEYSSAFLHMFTAPPQVGCPLHLGTSFGIAIPTLLNNIYSGTYSSSGAVLPRYSSASLDALTGRPPLRFRVTSPAIMADWLETNVYQPFGIVPLTDSSGRLTPKSVWWPNSSSGITFTFQSSNLADHPSWQHPGREQVTALRYSVRNEFWRAVPPGTTLMGNPGGDGIDQSFSTVERTHDRVSQFGRLERDVSLAGLPTAITGPINYDPSGLYVGGGQNLGQVLDRLAVETFDRYGDGPIVGTLSGMASAEAVQPGDWVKITLPTFPNPATNARGGTRLVQVVSRDLSPAGPDLTYLDGGRLQTLTAPTVSLTGYNAPALSARHRMKVTLGSLTSGATCDLEFAVGSTRPASGSTRWHPMGSTFSTAGTYVMYNLPSNTTFWGRARQRKARRLRSAWGNSTGGVATDSIPAPTISGVTQSSGVAALAWSAGSTLYPSEVFIDDSTSASFSISNRAGLVAAGGTRYRLFGLSSGTYLTGVRHMDAWGGRSAADSTVFTSTGPATADALLGLFVLQGRSTA